MFPKWEFDVEDTLAENIIKLMFVKKPWKWTMDCWEFTGTWVNTKPTFVSPAKKKVVKEDSPRPRKKARKEAPAEAKATDAMRKGFGMCLKEIKYLLERVEAVEKKVGITTKRKGTSSQNTTSSPKPTLEPGTKS
ncbi:BnaC09g11860D [Brassica napus]|uniref:BnaC09g11860D protein n=1 Tax=Brassica napus TaxID=3708 RepID=A0A078GJP8_BRANA|nr:BnaC09g11860D [Brassica napus]